jgi:hypothetical protein
MDCQSFFLSTIYSRFREQTDSWGAAPLLDLVEALEQRDRDENSDGFLSMTDFNLPIS